MIQTSYFGNRKLNKDMNLISIARATPKYFNILEYKQLAPDNCLLSWYKKGNCSQRDYFRYYVDNILNKLNVHNVVKELGEEPVLLCYERPEHFCHRKIVSAWFKKSGYEVKEFDY